MSVVRKLPISGGVDLLGLHRINPLRYPALLDSATQRKHSYKLNDAARQNSRYSLGLCFPQSTISLSASNQLSVDGAPCEGAFLEQLESSWAAVASRVPEGEKTPVKDLPFSGGWFLYLGYELVAEVEPRVAVHPSKIAIAQAVRIPSAVIIDHQEQSAWWVDDNLDGGAEDRYMAMLSDLEAAAPPSSIAVSSESVVEEPGDIYLAAIDKVKQYIVDGDIFQANLSRGWELECDASAADIFSALAEQNPAPFAALAVVGDATIISSSPERLVESRGQHVVTRPIAGTHPRALIAADDNALATRLLAHPKERAEHIMLIDLERNDLGRICEPGTVAVDDLMTVESYAWVHHIVSGVSGTLRHNVRPTDVIRAVFPGGTITGCPKVRCMEIIHQLEPEARGAYTGSLGYLNHDGSMDLNILIRTLVKQGNQLGFRAGGGIVAESDPERELDETRAKARGVLKAFGHA